MSRVAAMGIQLLCYFPLATQRVDCKIHSTFVRQNARNAGICAFSIAKYAFSKGIIYVFLIFAEKHVRLVMQKA